MRVFLAAVVLLSLLPAVARAEGLPEEVADIVTAELGELKKGTERSGNVIDARRKFAGAEVVVFEVEVRTSDSLARVLYIADVTSRTVYLAHELHAFAKGDDAWRVAFGVAWKDLNGDKISEVIFTRTALEGSATDRPSERVYQVRYGALRLVPRHLVDCRTANEAPLATADDVGLGALRKAADKEWRASFDKKPAAQRCAIANLAILGEGAFPSAGGGIVIDKRAPRTMLHYHGSGIGLLRADEGGTLIDEYVMPALLVPEGGYVASQSYAGFAAIFIEPGYAFVWFEITVKIIAVGGPADPAPVVYGVLYEDIGKGRDRHVVDEVLVSASGKVKRTAVVAGGKVTIKEGKKVVATWRWDAARREWKKK